MTAENQSDADESQVSKEEGPASAIVEARGLAVNGEHGALFSGIDVSLARGFHAIQMPGGPAQQALLLTLAGRFKPSHGTVAVLGDTKPRTIRRHCAIAAFEDIDELEESVTVRTVLNEQRRWLAPWFSRVSVGDGYAEMCTTFGDLTPPPLKSYLAELDDLDLFLLRISLALLSDRPILVIGDLEQVRDNFRRELAVERLGWIATHRTVVVGVTNPLGPAAPDHELHHPRAAIGRN